MINEIPANPKRGEKVALHWSSRRPKSGLMITRQGGKFGVWNISPIGGASTAFMFDLADTESEARAIANREWRGQGL